MKLFSFDIKSDWNWFFKGDVRKQGKIITIYKNTDYYIHNYMNFSYTIERSKGKGLILNVLSLQDDRRWSLKVPKKNLKGLIKKLITCDERCMNYKKDYYKLIRE